MASFGEKEIRIRRFVYSKHRLDKIRTALKCWRRVCPSSIPDKPKRDAVAAIRLTTGHDCLAAHLHRLRISTETFCPLCDSREVMERDHLLRYGLHGLSEVSRYWEV
ncbi:hypothetical protein AVEN_201235-1 [Araneus ventricosus]|uniref:Uncharacterized protein n=1 Tax=Araneus ventricosus TaxID=182803 RepID=A0A4Y2HK15_ARAVE|nr:hypothetical protein AVEN_201235-1 [Araneus ventricosus]